METTIGIRSPIPYEAPDRLAWLTKLLGPDPKPQTRLQGVCSRFFRPKSVQRLLGKPSIAIVAKLPRDSNIP